MKAHLEPIVFLGRVLEDEGSYGDTYKGVFTVHKMGTKAEVVGAFGALTTEVFRDVKRQLRSLGITSMTYTHAGEDRKVLL